MPLLLIPLDAAVPAVQAYLAEYGRRGLLDETEAARRLSAAVATSEVLVAFALAVAGRPFQS